MNKNIKNIIFTLLRILIVAGIFYYLIKFSQFDPSKLKKALYRPDLFFTTAVLFFIGFIISAQRWRMILFSQGVSIDFMNAAKLTMIGFFFSAAIPGSVSGDIIKAYYAAKGSEKKTTIVTSIFFDRIMGMYTMVLVAFITVVSVFTANYISGKESIWSQPYFRGLGIFIIVLFFSLTAMGFIFMNKTLKNSSYVNYILKKFPFHSIIEKVYAAVNIFGSKPLSLLKVILVSILTQIPGYIGILILALILGIKELAYLDYLIVLPVCFLINAIPVAPGGLGVGEVGFRKIFFLFGSQEGAELAFLLHMIFYILAIGIGGLVYMLSDVSKNYKNLKYHE